MAQQSNSEKLLEERSLPPIASNTMYKQVSQYRRGILAGEVESGHYRDGKTPYNSGLSKMGDVVSISGGLSKAAQTAGPLGIGTEGGAGAGWRGPGNTGRQIPEVYSPLWLNTNLNLPRDRATINAWCRSFYALHPEVQNAINLHSTYPISKLTIKCPNRKVEKFFTNMIEEIDLLNICSQVAQEYWLLGEAFVYAELDERKAKWSRLIIQNPDYIVVKRSVIANEPLIMLRPDENLRRITFSNKPSDIEQRRQLNETIVEHIKRGENIPLDNFYVSHLARKISPYEVRGTGLPVSCFRALMIMDQMRESKYVQSVEMVNPITIVRVGGEGSDALHPTHQDLEAWREVFACHDEETEVMTDKGFRKFSDVIDYNETDGKITNVKPKKDFSVACFNPETEMLEYHEPSGASLYNYDGNMHHFFNEKMDIKVTPNHKMWISEKKYEYNGHRSLRKTYWNEWHKVEAQDLKVNEHERFRSDLKWIGKETEYVDVCGKNIPTELYLEYLGYVIGEGQLYTNGKSQHTIKITQKKDQHLDTIDTCVRQISQYIDKSYSLQIRKDNTHDWIFCSKYLHKHFSDEVADGIGRTKCYFKQVPSWIKELSPRLLQIFLDALVAGDGSTMPRKSKGLTGFAYYTTSKILSDDVYEIAYKCGYVPNLMIEDSEEYIRGVRQPLYTVLWSNTKVGNRPLINKTSRNSQTKEKHKIFDIEQYNGKVWCFTVPTGLFITRRNGKITIQGNSAQYDRDFKIITHAGVQVERVGFNQAIYDTMPDIQQLLKEIFMGLMVPEVIMSGSADITYANGGVALDVLRSRYMSFRQMLSQWLRKKIFAPISKLNEFYDHVDGEKVLIVPDIDWSHMSVFDTMDYINVLVQLSGTEPGTKKVSQQTLYRSLGLEYEEEQRKIKKEDIHDAIRKKEQMSLDRMALNDLRALSDDDDIPEIAETPQGGSDSPYSDQGQAPPGGDMGGLGALPGVGGGPPGGGSPLPPLPPPSPGGISGAGPAPGAPPPK